MKGINWLLDSLPPPLQSVENDCSSANRFNSCLRSCTISLTRVCGCFGTFPTYGDVQYRSKAFIYSSSLTAGVRMANKLFVFVLSFLSVAPSHSSIGFVFDLSALAAFLWQLA